MCWPIPAGVISRSTRTLARRTPLEAKTRSVMPLPISSPGSHPADASRVVDEGSAAYFEITVAARLARHAALVQNARAGGDLMSWSDLNRPAVPDIRRRY